MPAKKDYKAVADGVKVYCNHDKLLSVSELIPHPNNPNKHPEEQIELLAKIIQKNGWRDRIVISNRSGMIVKGHGRYQAAIRAGLSKVPVEYQNYESDAAEIKDLIADNKIAELSEIDNKEAFELIEGLGEDDFDLEMAGFQLEDFQDDWGGGSGKNKGGEAAPEIEFSEELLLEHNYIVLYFDNEFDWHVAIDKFGLKKVKDLIERKGQPTGIGRVLNGAEWLKRIS
jgi:hypothetical protein